MRRWVLGAAVVAAVVVVVPQVTAADPAPPQTSRRLADSEDIATAAVDLSRGTWDDGEAALVVLARDDVFADSLAGASLAGTDGPILFTSPTTLDAVTAEEIDRVLESSAEDCAAPGTTDV